MGKVYTAIDVRKAKEISKTWVVTAASKEIYFTNNEWRSDVVSAEIEQEWDQIIFIMPNGDFVQVE